MRRYYDDICSGTIPIEENLYNRLNELLLPKGVTASQQINAIIKDSFKNPEKAMYSEALMQELR